MKNIVITGASRGIGLSLARKFQFGGYQVFANARNPDRLAEVQKEHPAIQFASVDATDAIQVRAYMAALQAKPGHIDVLINNAGTFKPYPIHQEPEGLLQEMLDGNLFSAYNFTRAVLPDMMERKQGTILTIASVASLRGFADCGAYAVAKHALLGFCRSLREELKPYGIRVITLLPGATHTSAWEGSDMDPSRLMDPDDLAELAWSAVHTSSRTVIEEMLIRPFLGDL